MAQTTSDNPTEGVPRPLPRGSRPARSRDTRPRFQPLDAVWMTLLAILWAGISYTIEGLGRRGYLSLVTGAFTVALTYLLGWRASGRPAGIIAGLLLATSAVSAAVYLDTWGSAAFALVTVAALFAFVAGSSLAALALAVIAVWLQPESIVLGLMLMTLSLVQKRQRAVLGAALFLVPAIAIWAYLLGTDRLHPAQLLCYNPALLRWITSPETVFLTWFLMPFLGELGDPIRRARWLPVLLWTGPALILGTVFSAHDDWLAPLLPLWFVLIGAGIARLLPAMTGDVPIPSLRYVLATLAVLSLVAIRARSEWPRPMEWPCPQAQATPQVTSPMPAAVPLSAPVSVRKKKPAKKVKKPAPLAKLLPKRPLAVKPQAILKIAPTKPAVPLYTIKNGRMVKRSKWAIQWDLTHPKP